MAKKNALGRGLGALIEDANVTPSVQVGSVNLIPVESIVTNPYQPRKNFDEESLQELASSIREMGVIQPITVRETSDSDKFQLITGERRLRAAKIAGLEKIPAYVRKADDQGMLEMALVENIQREDLDAIEIALSYQRLIDECNLTQENLSERVGKKRSTVANYLRLLKLPAKIQLGIRDKKISMGHAKAIIGIDDPETQLMIYDQVIKYDFSVRKVEEIVRELDDGKNTKEIKQKFQTPQEYNHLKEHLTQFFNSKVNFRINQNGKGKIEIHFASQDDLERILSIFDKLKQ
ncbi:MAG: ParB/RepB/Spo0J family partition protein [Marinilabiliales bacterium]